MSVQPDNVLPVSAPGSFSTRTDRQPMAQLPDAAYGEQQAFQQIQGGAPMAKTPPFEAPGAGAAASAAAPIPGLFDPTARPDEPLTAGVPVGPGPNKLSGASNMFREDMQMLSKYLPDLEAMARQKGTPRSFQVFVQYLQGHR